MFGIFNQDQYWMEEEFRQKFFKEKLEEKFRKKYETVDFLNNISNEEIRDDLYSYLTYGDYDVTSFEKSEETDSGVFGVHIVFERKKENN